MEKPIVVYTYGVFDLLHVGHVQLLREAKELGGKLIVGVYTDEAAEGFKRRPIIAQEHRAELLQALGFVDETVYQEEFLPDTNLRKIRPHILAKGPGASWEEGKTPPGMEVMVELGGKVVFLKYHDGISTSQIITRCKEC